MVCVLSFESSDELSCLEHYLTLEINEFRCYEAEIEESEKASSHWESTQNTSSLSCQCSATEPQQPDNCQPPQSSIHTAQVLLNASLTYLPATQYVLFHFPLFSPNTI